MSRKPCDECPFRRDIEPGFLGGSPAGVYVGRTLGPFILNCHKAPGYRLNPRDPNGLQCAGGAIFRANIGVAEIMPGAILTLEPDAEIVFTSAAEFLAHHQGMTIDEAEEYLREHTPAMHLQAEYLRAGCQVILIPRENKS